MKLLQEGCKLPSWKELKGQKIRDLLILEDYRDEHVDPKNTHWCKCISDNGKIVHIKASVLTRRLKRGNPSRHYNKHNMTHTRFYGIYCHIYQRCTNPNNDRYADYGGRGIKCLWGSFQEFYDDMYESYEEHFNANNGDTSIDRIDVNGDYCKSNCRWLTNKEQQANKQGTTGIEVDGKLLSFKEYCKVYNLPCNRIRYAAKKKNINVLQELYEGGWLNA